MKFEFEKIIKWIVVHKTVILSCLASILALLCAIFNITACGVTKAVVRNNADSTTTTISVSTSNPTTVQVDPNVRIQFNKDSTIIKHND